MGKSTGSTTLQLIGFFVQKEAIINCKIIYISPSFADTTSCYFDLCLPFISEQVYELTNSPRIRLIPLICVQTVPRFFDFFTKSCSSFIFSSSITLTEQLKKIKIIIGHHLWRSVSEYRFIKILILPQEYFSTDDVWYFFYGMNGHASEVFTFCHMFYSMPITSTSTTIIAVEN